MYHKNNADLIVPGLWLGNAKAAMDEEFLKKHKITCVFNCTKDQPFHSHTRKRYRIPVDDNLQPQEIRNLELWSYEIVYKLAREHKNESVLVHCYAGMQRSAAVIAMYLIARYSMKKDNAVTFIRKQRPIAFWPFVNFEKSIEGFQRNYENDIIPKLLTDLESPR
jgi:protein-tyrosine phosphatase